jgi:hypothetical protein
LRYRQWRADQDGGTTYDGGSTRWRLTRGPSSFEALGADRLREGEVAGRGTAALGEGGGGRWTGSLFGVGGPDVEGVGLARDLGGGAAAARAGGNGVCLEGVGSSAGFSTGGIAGGVRGATGGSCAGLAGGAANGFCIERASTDLVARGGGKGGVEGARGAGGRADETGGSSVPASDGPEALGFFASPIPAVSSSSALRLRSLLSLRPSDSMIFFRISAADPTAAKISIFEQSRQDRIRALSFVILCFESHSTRERWMLAQRTWSGCAGCATRPPPGPGHFVHPSAARE